MARIRVLNPRPAPTELGAGELSRAILAAARTVAALGECTRLDALTGQLHGVAPEAIEDDASRVAFWCNLYNALVIHCRCLRPFRGSVLLHLRLFDRVAYRLGSHDYPLSLIENGILRTNRRPPFRLRRPLRRSDPRLAAAPSMLDPRIHFALNCGARSCPPVRSYEPERLDDQLELATRAYLVAETELDPDSGRVRLPRLMRIYRVDFGARPEQLRFAGRYVPQLGEWLEHANEPLRVAYRGFDWRVGPAATPVN